MFSPMLLWDKKHNREAVANEDANVWCMYGLNIPTTFSLFTHYLESFSNMVFVSSSVSGLIFNCLKRVYACDRNRGKRGTLQKRSITWGFTEAVILFSGSEMT